MLYRGGYSQHLELRLRSGVFYGQIRGTNHAFTLSPARLMPWWNSRYSKLRPPASTEWWGPYLNHIRFANPQPATCSFMWRCSAPVTSTASTVLIEHRNKTRFETLRPGFLGLPPRSVVTKKCAKGIFPNKDSSVCEIGSTGDASKAKQNYMKKAYIFPGAGSALLLLC